MNKAAIRDRAGGRCEYCRDPEWLSLAAFHAEHIISRQCGGGDDDDHLALACPDCNLAKGPNIAALDPESGELTRLFHPRRDSWTEHFQNQRHIRPRLHTGWQGDGESAGLERHSTPKASDAVAGIGRVGSESVN